MDEFWDWIEKINDHKFVDHVDKIEFITTSLTSFQLEEIKSFDDILHELISNANNADLWNLAIAIYCGCSRSSFKAFCSWLIFKGLNTYEKVVKDPILAIGLINHGDDVCDERYQFVAQYAYLILTNKEMTLERREYVKLRGELAESVTQARKMYPAVAEKYGDCN
ncbi:MAG: DUF4240 domain-containing protein [Bacteroidota bacterium]